MSGPQIMFVCDYCSEHNPEMCGHYDAEDIRLAPNGSWLCESCFDEETPSDLARFSDAPVAYLEAAPSPSPAPGVVTDEMVETAARAYAEHQHGKGCPVWEEELPPMRAALASLSQPAKGEREGGE